MRFLYRNRKYYEVSVNHLCRKASRARANNLYIFMHHTELRSFEYISFSFIYLGSFKDNTLCICKHKSIPKKYTEEK